jgi:hypothetical protein
MNQKINLAICSSLVMLALANPVLAGDCLCKDKTGSTYRYCADSIQQCKSTCTNEHDPSGQGFGWMQTYSGGDCNVCANLPGKEKFDVLDCKNHGSWFSVKIKCTKGGNAGHCWQLACNPGGDTCNINYGELRNGLSQWNVGRHCDGPGNKHFVSCD